LVEQIRGFNEGKLYAMKSMKMKKVTADRNSLWLTMMECRVLAEVGDSPFLVKSHYTFITQSHLHLVMGEYIKNCSHVWDRPATGCLVPESQRTEVCNYV
jgi:hypothetical protein